jgi:hypothetical protein
MGEEETMNGSDTMLDVLHKLEELRDNQTLSVEQRCHDLLQVAAFAASFRSALIRGEEESE